MWRIKPPKQVRIDEAHDGFESIFLNIVWDTLEATPFIGHILAALEKQMGNKEKARRINFVANRSTSVLSGAVLGT